MSNNLHLTLEDLELSRWGEPELKSHLVTECHRLRKVPIGHFTNENLRIMIGQRIGLPHLVPIALSRLFEAPFLEGDYYPGDLLLAVTRAASEFWQAYPALLAEMQVVIGRVEDVAKLVRDEVLPTWNAHFR